MKKTLKQNTIKSFTYFAVSLGFLFTGNAIAAPFSCTELGIFARGVGVARDTGTPLYRIYKIIDEDPGFTQRDKIEFTKLASKIYNSYSISPEYLEDIAKNECIRTGKRKR